MARWQLIEHKEMDEKTIRKIAEDHWVFIEGLFFALPDESQFGISTVEYLYKEAFVHGWKHATNQQEGAGN